MATSHSTLKIEPGKWYRHKNNKTDYYCVGFSEDMGAVFELKGREVFFCIKDTSCIEPAPETVVVWFKRYEDGDVICSNLKPKTRRGETVWYQEVELTPPPEEEPPF